MRTSITRRVRGFTLIELMVTVLVGSIVIAGVYSIYTESVRGYRVQNHALEGLGQLRMAVRQVRADLRSAGFNAPAQSNQENWVDVPVGLVLSAVAVDVDPDPQVPHPSSNQNIEPQRIRLMGDFFAHKTFTSEVVAGTTVTLPWDVSDGDEIAFHRIFNDRRMLRIETFGVARREQIIPIQSASFNGGVLPQITLQEPVSGISGFGGGHEVSVLGYVRYRLKRDMRRNNASLKWDLVREELDAKGNAVPGTALIVSEYVVDLQVYDVCLNVTPPEAGTMRQVPVAMQCFANLAALSASPYTLDGTASNASHLLRSMTVKISTRAPYEDEDLPFAPRGALDAPLNSFELEPEMKGAARVYEMASTVTLVSVQARRQ
jgi:prepilin-type N-terminal cleavage/methylation domain-containing protein